MTAVQRLRNVLEGRELTMADLRTVTHLSPGAIVTGLYQLRQMGVLQTETIPRRSVKGRPRVRYSMASAAVTRRPGSAA